MCSRTNALACYHEGYSYKIKSNLIYSFLNYPAPLVEEGEGRHALMPIGDYSFSKKFGWLTDRFGVSWQLTLPL